MRLYPIHAGYFSCDGGSLFSVIPKAMWSKFYPADENNVVKLSLRCLLVDTGDRKILIEAGVGNHYPEKVRRNNGHEETDVIEHSLALAGYSPSDITDVLFTHLHWDHCNGAVLNDSGKLRLQFPRATHWCSRRQWEHAKVSNAREQAAYYPDILNFLKEEGHMQLVDEACELFPGISVRLFDGHTPGQMIPFINTGDKTYVYMADLIPTSANIPIVWLASYDLYPVTAMEEKEAFLREVVQKNYILFFEHDLFTQCVTVLWGEKGPRVKERFSM